MIEPNEFEKSIFSFMQSIKNVSKCQYRKVVCVLATKRRLITFGINNVLECNKECFDKENRICKVIHAEIEALDKLQKSKYKANKNIIAYLNHYPCTACQKLLRNNKIKVVKIFSQHVINNLTYYRVKYDKYIPIQIFNMEELNERR